MDFTTKKKKKKAGKLSVAHTPRKVSVPFHVVRGAGLALAGVGKGLS